MLLSLIPGDGTGPEVVAEARKVLDAAAKHLEFEIEYVEIDVGGRRYLETGETITDEDLARLAATDAILFGAIGHPDVPPGVLEQGILLRLRFELDQYINLRPLRLYPGVAPAVTHHNSDILDLVVVRENSEGLYSGIGRFEQKGTRAEVAIQESVNTRSGTERTIRYAFEVAAARPRRLVTLIGKTNVLTFAWDLWQRTFDEVAKDYPNIETGYAHIDAACYWLIDDPGRFDVVVTDNMFGDIFSDLGAALIGGLGIAAGANLNPAGVSMFEPIGGTAPGFEGKNEINPLAAINAAGLLLTHTGYERAGETVGTAVAQVAAVLPSLAAGRMGAGTNGVGDMVVERIEALT